MQFYRGARLVGSSAERIELSFDICQIAEQFVIPVAHDVDEVVVRVKDKDVVGSKVMGVVRSPSILHSVNTESDSDAFSCDCQRILAPSLARKYTHVSNICVYGVSLRKNQQPVSSQPTAAWLELLFRACWFDSHAFIRVTLRACCSEAAAGGVCGEPAGSGAAAAGLVSAGG